MDSGRFEFTSDAAVAFVTGATMANFTALAAARGAGWPSWDGMLKLTV